MNAYRDIPNLPHIFRGALAFNQRTLSGAIKSLLGESSPKAPKSLSFSDLSNVLLVLESIAMSSGMCLDGTLPPADVTDMESALARIRDRSGVALDVEFLKPPAATLHTMFKSAANAAALLINEHLGSLDEQTDKPLSGDVDISKFVAGLESASNSTSAHEIALDIADKAAVGVETFRGSKCLAALILADQDPIPLVELAAKTIVGAPEATQRKAIAVLINRFRINYVNSLATLRDAAYLADTAIEPLKVEQVMVFSRYFAEKIAAQYRDELSVATRKLFDQNLGGAPLGFAILMNSRGTSAPQLLEEATRIRSLEFVAAAARETPQKRFLHQFDEAEFSNFRDYLFSERWSNLVKPPERSKFASCLWRTIQSPAAVGTAAMAGVALAVMALGPGALAAGAAVGGGLMLNLEQFAGAHVPSGTEANVVAIDQYRKLDKYFAAAAEDDRVVKALADRVERLFGRPLDVSMTA